eukprot:15205_6
MCIFIPIVLWSHKSRFARNTIADCDRSILEIAVSPGRRLRNDKPKNTSDVGIPFSPLSRTALDTDAQALQASHPGRPSRG